MSAKLTLDSFVTTLACLATYTEPGSGPSFEQTPSNAMQQLGGNMTTMGCSPQAIATLNAQVRNLRSTDDSLIQQMSQLQRSLDIVTRKLSQLEKECADSVPSCIGQRKGPTSIRTNNGPNFLVFCEQILPKHGDNWLLFVNREDGSTEFNKGWNDYKEGFGEFSHDLFLGLDKLHVLTTRAIHELLIILTKRSGETVYAHYDYFGIGGESEGYALKLLNGYSGDAGDALSYHAGQKFTTFDRDNDENELENCARKHTGAWWYKSCMESNLFGQFQTFGERDILASKGILWKGFLDGPLGSIKTVKMYIRPKEDTK